MGGDPATGTEVPMRVRTRESTAGVCVSHGGPGSGKSLGLQEGTALDCFRERPQSLRCSLHQSLGRICVSLPIPENGSVPRMKLNSHLYPPQLSGPNSHYRYLDRLVPVHQSTSHSSHDCCVAFGKSLVKSDSLFIHLTSLK